MVVIFKMEEDSSESIRKHPALDDPSAWTFLNEGNNNIILRYTGKETDSALTERMLRIRKSTNAEFYTDPCLLPEEEYNELLLRNVFLQDHILAQYLQ